MQPPNTALQQSGAPMANLMATLGCDALLQNERLSMFSAAPAAERQVRYADAK